MDKIDEYIQQYDQETQKKLYLLRYIIKETAPQAIEKILWGLPTYNDHGFLVQFAANKKHIGFYCSPAAIQHFQKELKPYKTNNRNTIHFAYNQALPIQLIQQIILYRILENRRGCNEIKE